MKALLKVKIVVLIMSVAMVLNGAAFAGTEPVRVYNTEKADALKEIGLFAGTDKGYELDKIPNRAQAAVMLVKLLGKEDYAKQMDFKHPFKDVPAWASAAVGYIYSLKITSGVSATEYGSAAPVTAAQYVSYVLRSLEYTSFDWKYSLDYAWDAGLLDKDAYDSLSARTFTRDDMVGISYGALNSVLNKSTKRLVNKLIDAGTVDGSKAEAAGFNVADDFYAVDAMAT